MRVVLDTNIYISAILFGGNPREIINLARLDKIKVLTSEYILWELRSVLKNKFDVPENRLNTIEHDILNLATLVRITTYINEIKKDPADNNILSCAIDGKAKAIITGNKHLLEQKKYENIQIIKPRDFLSHMTN